MKALSQTCDYGDYLTEALRDQLVFGVGNQKIQAALLRERDLTFDKACSVAKSIELANQHVDLMQLDNIVSVFARNRLGQPGMMRGKRNSRFANYQCYTCGVYGHTSRQCRGGNSFNQENERFGQKPVKRNCKDRINEVVGERKGETISHGDEKEEDDVDFMSHLTGKGPVFIEVNVNNHLLKMAVDTGAEDKVIKHFP